MKSSIQEKLKSNNKNLDGLVRKDFITDAKLDIPEVGKYSFKDISNDFEYALLEYSITHSKVINNYKSRPSHELLELNNIPTESYELLVEKVNEILKSHTDEALSVTSKRQILENQIIEFTGHYPDEETKDKMFQSLLVSEDNTKKNNYLDSVISAMQKAEVNQMEDNKYMVLAPLFAKYDEFTKYMEDFNFREKKKYLQKLQKTKSNNAISALVKYTNQLLEDNEQDIKIIQWFFFYLIYGKNELDIFMIHSMQGYKYASAAKLYQKLFCKDHSTGRKDDFLHHTNIFNLQKKHLEDEVFHMYETILHYL